MQHHCDTARGKRSGKPASHRSAEIGTPGRICSGHDRRTGNGPRPPLDGDCDSICSEGRGDNAHLPRGSDREAAFRKQSTIIEDAHHRPQRPGPLVRAT
ncbi:hypothetical protein FOZ60_012677 [Perkinsus olseni]|uniref:Uncharacterized protein n=1 Tax=Perkinsus olseni TaxID=32597 RepID=A0A7J6P9K5_PEROL|nr:hypothetical protein FOZ60_012677 [Perkinsus olseni]